MKYTIFTDGSSRGNPGPGGWGAVVVSDTQVTELGGREDHTTNNRMELTAVVEALSHIEVGSSVIVHSDSKYVINGITSWIKGWKSNGWVTKTKDDVVNKDLWMRLDAVVKERQVTWKYVGGHIGILGNERCDEIATAYADESDIVLYTGALVTYSIPNILDISFDEASLVKKKSSSSKSGAKAYSYVSAVGGVIQTHATWAECEKRVKGTKGARFKKSFSKEDEAAIIASFK